MQNRHGKHRTPVGERDFHPAAKIHRRGTGFSRFLMDTKITPLVIVGQCAQYFGLSTVAGFILGAASLYAYGVFKPLPYLAVKAQPVSQSVATPSAAAETKKIQLRGLVRTAAGEPAKWFNVGVFANRLGPLDNSDGSFALDVPQSSSYDVVFWTTDERIHVFQGNSAEKDGNAYKLQNVLKLTPQNQLASAPRSRPNGSTSRGQIARLESEEQ